MKHIKKTVIEWGALIEVLTTIIQLQELSEILCIRDNLHNEAKINNDEKHMSTPKLFSRLQLIKRTAKVIYGAIIRDTLLQKQEVGWKAHLRI